VLINDHEQFVRADFENEAEIEGVVQRFATQLFGDNSIYLPQARISTHGGAGTIPDAVVIDVASEEWYVVEAERGVHGTWQHIAPQVSKQLAAVRTETTRERLLDLALQQVRENAETRRMLADLDIEEIAIHQKLLAILRKEPTIAIPIDFVPKDLKEWIVTLRNRAKIWVIEKYVSVDDSQRVLYSIPDENMPTISTHSTTTGSVSTVTRSSSPWQDLWHSGALHDGMPLTMVYGPRGHEKETFRGLVRENGIEVDGGVFSPSYAAVRCIQKAGSDRRTANGWIVWRTETGELINDLYERVMAEDGQGNEAAAGDQPQTRDVGAGRTIIEGA